MKPKYIFVVGCFRSGTTLLAKILDSSDEISFIREETKFVGGLFRSGLKHRMRKVGDLSLDDNLRKMVATIYSDSGANIKGCYQWLRSHVKQEDFLQRLLTSDRSDRSIFEIMLGLHAELYCHEECILGEKTPSHVYHVPTLMDWFPQAKIVHIIRDPRAVLVSQLNRKRGYMVKQFTSFPLKCLNPLFVFAEVLHVTVSWLRGASLHFKYQNRYPKNYYSLKYENLIETPENTLRQLSDFMDISFDPKMLKQQVIGSSFSNEYVGNFGFDKKIIQRWRTQIKPWMKIWTKLFCRRYLKKFNYY